MIGFVEAKADRALDAAHIQKVTGLVEGCSVLTLDGYKPIGALNVDDRIITRRGLRQLRSVEVSTRCFHAMRITKGTLGFYRPNRDLLLAPDQELFVRDWRAQMIYGRDAVVVPISRIADGTYICEDDTAKMHKVFDLRFDEEEVFYVDGVEVMAKQVAKKEGASPLFA